MMALKNLIIYWLKLIKSAGAKMGINEIRSVQIYWWRGFMLTLKIIIKHHLKAHKASLMELERQMMLPTNKYTSAPYIKHILSIQTSAQHTAERRGSRKQLVLIFQDGCLTYSVTELPQGWWPLSLKWGTASRASLGHPFSFSVSQPSLLPPWCLGMVMCNLYFNCSPSLCCWPVDTMVHPID